MGFQPAYLSTTKRVAGLMCRPASSATATASAMGGWSSGKYTSDYDDSDVEEGEEVNQPWLLPEEEEEEIEEEEAEEEEEEEEDEEDNSDDDDDGDGSDGDDHGGAGVVDAPPAAKRQRLQ